MLIKLDPLLLLGDLHIHLVELHRVKTVLLKLRYQTSQIYIQLVLKKHRNPTSRVESLYQWARLGTHDLIPLWVIYGFKVEYLTVLWEGKLVRKDIPIFQLNGPLIGGVVGKAQ